MAQDATDLLNIYQFFGGVGNRLDAMLSIDGGRLVADDPAAIAACNAVVAGEYTWRPGKHVWIITRTNILMGETPKVELDKYGMGALTDGLIVAVKNNNGSIKHRFNTKPITRVIDWSLLTGEPTPPQDRVFVTIRWTLAKAESACIFNAGVGEYFSVFQPEAPVGLTDHFFNIQGFRLDFNIKTPL